MLEKNVKNLNSYIIIYFINKFIINLIDQSEKNITFRVFKILQNRE